MPRDAFVLKIQRILSPEMSRKLRNQPQVTLVEGDYSHQSSWTQVIISRAKSTDLHKKKKTGPSFYCLESGAKES